MPPEPVIRAADICQAVVPFVSLMAYLPQWAKLRRLKSSDSFSLRSWCAWSVTSAFALFYAAVQLRVTGRGWPLLAATTLGLVFVLFTLFLVVRYRKGTVKAGPSQSSLPRAARIPGPPLAAR